MHVSVGQANSVGGLIAVDIVTAVSNSVTCDGPTACVTGGSCELQLLASSVCAECIWVPECKVAHCYFAAILPA